MPTKKNYPGPDEGRGWGFVGGGYVWDPLGVRWCGRGPVEGPREGMSLGSTKSAICRVWPHPPSGGWPSSPRDRSTGTVPAGSFEPNKRTTSVRLGFYDDDMRTRPQLLFLPDFFSTAVSVGMYQRISIRSPKRSRKRGGDGGKAGTFSRPPFDFS